METGLFYAPGEHIVGNEVVLYRWPELDYEVARVVSLEQLCQINNSLYHDIDISVLTSSLLNASDYQANSVIMVLRRVNSHELIAAVILDDLAAGAYVPGAGHEWKKGSQIPKSGLRRWSVETIRLSGKNDPKALSGLEASLLCSFLFGWLGLDPQWMQASARRELSVPFLTKKPSAASELPNQPLVTSKDGLRDIVETVDSYIRDLTKFLFVGQMAFYFRIGPSTFNYTVTNRFIDIELRWHLIYLPSDQLGLQWSASLSSRSLDEGPRSDTPLEAINASGILTTPECLEQWLDDHWIPGEAKVPDTTMDTYEMLDVDLPPLMGLEDFLIFMRN